MRDEGINRRSNWFFASGHVLTGFVLCSFLIVFLPIGIIGQFWKQYFFNDLVQLKNACELGVTKEGVLSFKRVEIPDRFLTVENPTNDPSQKMIFRCKIPKLSASDGGHISHWGWMGGKSVEVKINGVQAFSFSGRFKPSFPVNGGEIVEFFITGSNPNFKLDGFVGVQPPVITSNYSDHMKINGIDLFLNLTRSLNFLFPIVALGLVIGFSWLSGYRARVLTVGMYVLAWSFAMRYSSILQVFGLEGRYYYAFFLSFRAANTASLALFFMELCRISPRKIYPFARIIGIYAAVSIAVLISADSNFNLQASYIKAINFFAFAMFSTLSIMLLRRRLQSKVFIPKSDHWAMIILSIGAFLSLIETINLYYEFVPTQISFFIDTIFQLSVALLILSNFSMSEKKYQKEKQNTLLLSQMVTFEKEKQSLLSRFLSGRITKKFNNTNSVDINLSTVLAAKERPIAVIQADIRGFTEMFSEKTSEEIALILKDYFGPVVNQFHDIAVVKLVGDRLFAFVEEDYFFTKGVSPTDSCVEIAAHLIHQISVLTESKYPGLNISVGIGINYGTAMVGNISSDQCIDYTVIGNTVNLSARLEELSKLPVIVQQFSTNCLVLGEGAVGNLLKYKEMVSTKFFVEEGVRSFKHIKTVSVIRSEDCLKKVFGDQSRKTAS